MYLRISEEGSARPPRNKGPPCGQAAKPTGQPAWYPERTSGDQCGTGGVERPGLKSRVQKFFGKDIYTASFRIGTLYFK